MSDPIVGIDLGTSNSVVAHADAMGNVKVLADDAGYKIHPSVVSFHPNGGVVVGAPAKQRKVIDPANTIYSVKRLIGRAFSSPEVKIATKRMPYQIKKGENELPLIVTRGGEFAVPEISAIVLDHVRNIGSTQLGQEVTRAVVTVPASFNDAQRSATATAGAIAGITVVRVLNEPTAAALAYGNARNLKQTIAVYDFGGGTFDITILRLNDQVYEVLGTAGDTFLGGDDLDERLVDKMVAKFLAENRIDLRDNEVSMMRLRAVAEQTKIELSRRSRAVVRVDEIAYGAKGKPLNLQIEITRDEFVTQVADIIDKTFPVCKEALSYASLGIDKIDDVILVGGTTKIPYVRDQVSKFFAKAPRTDVNPEDAVAVGAALQATSLERILSRSGRISAAKPVPQLDDDLQEPTIDTSMHEVEELLEKSGAVMQPPELSSPPDVRPRRITAGYATVSPSRDTPRPIDTSYSMPRSGTREVFEEKPSNAAIGRLRPTQPSQPLPRLQSPTAAALEETTSAEPIADSFEIMTPPPAVPKRTTAPLAPPPKPQTSRLPARSVPDAVEPGTSSPVSEWGSDDDFATKPGDAANQPLSPAATLPMPPAAPARRPSNAPIHKTMALPVVPVAPAPPRFKSPSTSPGIGATLLDLEDEAQPSAASTARGFEPPRPQRPSTAPPMPTARAPQAPTMIAPQAYPVMPVMPAMPVAPPRPAPIVMDVTPRSLGIATVAGFCEELIRRNSRLPAQMVKLFTTSRDKQSTVHIVVCQGESRRLDSNVIIGDLQLQNLPPRPRGETSIEVTFSLDASGILQVRARDANSGKEQRATLSLVGGVDDENVAAARDRLQQLRR